MSIPALMQPYSLCVHTDMRCQGNGIDKDGWSAYNQKQDNGTWLLLLQPELCAILRRPNYNLGETAYVVEMVAHEASEILHSNLYNWPEHMSECWLNRPWFLKTANLLGLHSHAGYLADEAMRDHNFGNDGDCR